jgi:hypothetical protein
VSFHQSHGQRRADGSRIVEQSANVSLHPDRQRRQSVPQIVAQSLPSRRIVQEIAQPAGCIIGLVGSDQVMQSVERLDNPHGGTARSIEFAGRSLLEGNCQIAELNGEEPGIALYNNFGGNRRRQAKIVRRRQPVHDKAGLIAPGHGVDDGVRGGCGDAAGQVVEVRKVVEAAVGTDEASRHGEMSENTTYFTQI